MLGKYLGRRTRADFIRTLLEANGVTLDEQTLAQLQKQYGVDLLSGQLEVPFELFLELTKYIHANHYGGTLSYQEACEVMGRNTVIAYFNTPVGKLLKVASKGGGFARSAQNFASSLRTIFPDAEVAVELADADTYKVRSSGVTIPPEFVKGMMWGGVEAVFGVPDKVEVVVVSSQKQEFTCQCWRQRSVK
jgi:uncharacterized protein (TIGR02265 family)